MPIELFEAFMLICFGSAWPFAIAKSLRSRSAGGKSPAFLMIIFTGYLSGITAHLLRGFSPVVLLYCLNASMVFADLCLVLRYCGEEESKVGAAPSHAAVTLYKRGEIQAAENIENGGFPAGVAKFGNSSFKPDLNTPISSNHIAVNG